MQIIRKKASQLSSSEVEEIMSFLDSNFSTIFHEPHFGSIVSDVFNTDFSYSFVRNNDGRLIALCPLHSMKDDSLIQTYSNPAMYEVPYGGWVFDRSEVSLLELVRRMKPSNNEALTYWSLPQVRDDDYSRIKTKRRFQTAIIDLGIEEDSIWQNVINSKRRNMIRKAQKNNIAIEKADHTGFDEYYQLMQQTYQYADLAIKPEQYYVRILRNCVPNDKAIILLAKMQSVVLAGVVLLRNRYICHYWLGTGRKDAQNLGQGELLQWEAIKWAKENGSQYYDVCVVEPERLPHIAKFKLGFSKRTAPFYCISRKGFAYRVAARAKRYCGRCR